jgi:hypothetical protein
MLGGKGQSRRHDHRKIGNRQRDADYHGEPWPVRYEPLFVGQRCRKGSARRGKSIVIDSRYGGGEVRGRSNARFDHCPLDGSELAEGVLPMVVDMAKKLALEVELFRAYHITYNVYPGVEGLYARNYEDLLVSVGDEAAEYLDKKAADLRTLRVAKVTCVTKESFATDEILALGRRTADNLKRWCVIRAIRC